MLLGWNRGLNKIKIQDKDGMQIYPSSTHFQFSGWRNRTPLHIPMNLQEETPPPDDLTYDEARTEDAPDPEHEHESTQAAQRVLPTFKSTADDRAKRRSRLLKQTSHKLNSAPAASKV